MNHPPLQRCQWCGQNWWRAHVCPKLNPSLVTLPPAQQPDREFVSIGRARCTVRAPLPTLLLFVARQRAYAIGEPPPKTIEDVFRALAPPAEVTDAMVAAVDAEGRDDAFMPSAAAVREGCTGGNAMTDDDIARLPEPPAQEDTK